MTTTHPTTGLDAGVPGTAHEALARARSEFAARGVYLDTASMGLPPRRPLSCRRSSCGVWPRFRWPPGGRCWSEPCVSYRSAQALTGMMRCLARSRHTNPAR